MAEHSEAFGDQAGNPILAEQFFESMSEAILANVIACESAGILPDNIKMIVGRDGGTVVGDGMVFETPVTVRLSEENGRRLFGAFARLYGAYAAKRIPPARLEQIRAAHNVAHKQQAIRNARSAR